MRFRAMRQHHELRLKIEETLGRDVYQDFVVHRTTAARRGIAFEMDFPAWIRAWGDDLASKGRRKGEKVMCRNGDVGPYSAENIRIDTASANGFERVQVLRRKAMKEAWTFDGVDNTSSADWLDNRRDMGYL